MDYTQIAAQVNWAFVFLGGLLFLAVIGAIAADHKMRERCEELKPLKAQVIDLGSGNVHIVVHHDGIVSRTGLPRRLVIYKGKAR